jgi:hypothetical protein
MRNFVLNWGKTLPLAPVGVFVEELTLLALLNAVRATVSKSSTLHQSTFETSLHYSPDGTARACEKHDLLRAPRTQNNVN